MSRLDKPFWQRIPRSTWLPTLLLLYLTAMTCRFAPALIRGGEIIRLVVVVTAELAIIALLYFFLKKREQQNHD